MQLMNVMSNYLLRLMRCVGLATLTVLFSCSSLAQAPAASTVLFQNVRVFDGKSESLTAPTNVLVVGNKIQKISVAPIPADPGAHATIVDGGGRTLMPGLIDAHTHLMLVGIPLAVAMTADLGYVELVAGQQAERMLMRGFTSARDLGGPVFGLKRDVEDRLSRTGHAPHPRADLRSHSRSRRPPHGASSIGKLGWSENAKCVVRQHLALANPNFAEVEFSRRHLIPVSPTPCHFYA